ncbi:uncharacterized protein L201_007646 [Kwoniella dendrophila CBS 6074]|uniref:Fe2OG dioxygenase domain-containing protein n=1 Tax=Kwoniella dendrophila CBS 6074 TaxID=1295534 RepID=A0AAX4K4Y0_9TREE
MAPSPFPDIKLKKDLTLNEVLPSQIYTIDDFLTTAELKAVLKWTENVRMEEPKPPGKGEAERTAKRGSIESTEIASTISKLLIPYVPKLLPKYGRDLKDLLLSPNIRVYHYPKDSFFDCHYDSPTLDLNSKRLSCWTILIYLTNVDKGGNTIFYTNTHDPTPSKSKKSSTKSKSKGGAEQVISVEPKSGRLLLHWHGLKNGGCLKHEGEKVEKGDKWVFRTDILA